MKTDIIIKYRNILRQFERELFFQNFSMCCNQVSLPQCHALLEIEEQPEISLKELADKLSLEKSTVSRTVDGLVKKGFLNRETPSENRRLIKLNLTETGSSTCESINWNNENYISEILSSFNRTEQSEFIRLFGKLTEKMNNMRMKGSQC